MVLEKVLESPLDNRIRLVNPKGNKPWTFFGRIDIEAEAPTFWPPDEKNQLIGKDTDAGKDRLQEEKGQQRIRLLDGIIDLMDMNVSKLREMVKDRKPGVLKSTGSQRIGHNLVTGLIRETLNVHWWTNWFSGYW